MNNFSFQSVGPLSDTLPPKNQQPDTVILKGSASPHRRQAFLQTKCILTEQAEHSFVYVHMDCYD